MGLRQILLALLTLLAAARAAAQTQPSAASPDPPVTCALIADPALGLPDSAAFALLTAKLSTQPGLALLERAEVNRVLQERSLQLALAAEGLEARRALGTLLKARLLVLLRAAERTVAGKKIRTLELAVAETSSGLRLLQDELRWDDAAPAALAPPVAADVARACARLAAPPRALLAVPPFLSGDLERRYDAMQDAYARLLAGVLADTAGLRVVELAEARAVADEIRLTGGGRISRELLPYYLQGRYRNQARDGRSTPTVTLTLELRRGEQTLGEKKSAPLAPEDAGHFLRAGAQELLGQVLQGRPLPFNPGVEAAELLRQARQFEQLAEAEKALTLTEAALLLQPAEPRILKLAIDRASAFIDGTQTESDPATAVARALAAHYRAMDHMALYLRLARPADSAPAADDVWRDGLSFHETIQRHLNAGRATYDRGVRDPALWSPISDLEKARRELVVSFFEYWADRPALETPVYMDMLNLPQSAPRRRFDRATIVESPAATRQALMRLIRAFLKKTDTPSRSAILALSCRDLRDAAENETYLAEIAALPGPLYPLVSRYARLSRSGYEIKDRLVHDAPARLKEETALRKDIETLYLDADRSALDASTKKDLLLALNSQARSLDDELRFTREQARLTPDGRPNPPHPTAPPQGQPVSPPAAPAGQDYALEPIRIPALAAKAIRHWIPAGGGLDLLASERNLYTLDPAGQLKEIPLPWPPAAKAAPAGKRTQDAPDALADLVFDGRWAWMPLGDLLLVIDPASGRLEKISAENGLPPGEKKVAPLAPGRVCVVGGFGRAWCAAIDYAGLGRVKVDVFHEARLVQGAWDDPQMAFKPRFAATLRGTDGRPRVLVGREMAERGNFCPLILDPERRRAEVLRERISSRLQAERIVNQEGMLYWVAGSGEIAGQLVNLAKPLDRIESYGGPEGRLRIVFNNISGPEDRYLPPGRAGRDAVPRIFFEGGRGFLLARSIWYLDPAGQRCIQLKGLLPAPFSARTGLGRSNRFGNVLIFPRPAGGGADYYAFRPAAGVEAELAALTKKDTGGRPALERDPIEGTPLVMRRYQVDDISSFTTMPAAIHSHMLYVERDGLTSRTLLALVGREQQDSWVRDWLGDAVESFDPMPVSTVNRDSSRVRGEPFINSLNFTRMAPPKTPLSFTFTDALGRPLAGATVLPALREDAFRAHPDAPGTVKSALAKIAFELRPPLRADARGRITLELSDPGARRLAFTVSHPDYGTAYCSVEFPFRPSRGNPSGAAATAPAGEQVLRTQLVRHGSPEERRAFRGRLVDEQGRPLAGLRVIAILPRADPSGGRNAYLDGTTPCFPVLSGPGGEVALYPFNFTPAAQHPTLPEDTALIVQVKPADVTRLPLLETALDNRSTHTLRIPRHPERPHTLFIVEPGGKRIDVGRSGIRIFRTQSFLATEPRQPANEGFSAGESAGPGEFMLPPGPYMVYYEAGRVVLPFTVTPATPHEIEVQVPRNLPPGAPLPTRSQGPGAPRAVLRYTGRVIDGLTGKPMPGFTVGMRSDRNNDYEHDSQTVKTDAAGRYELTCTPWESVSEIGVRDDRYLESAYRDFQTHWVPTSGTQGLMPPLMVYPAGRLRLSPRFESSRLPPGQQPGVKIDYALADPRDGRWASVFSVNHTPQSMVYHMLGFLRPNVATSGKIPAGVRIRITLTPLLQRVNNPLPLPFGQPRWNPEKIEREIELKPGETLDWGTVDFTFTGEAAARGEVAEAQPPTPRSAPPERRAAPKKEPASGTGESPRPAPERPAAWTGILFSCLALGILGLALAIKSAAGRQKKP